MIKKANFFIICFVLGFCFSSCKPENKKVEQLEKITVDKNLSKNKIFKLLSKYPELKLYNSERVESLTRTAHIVQEAGYYEKFLYSGEKNIDFFSLIIINVKRNTKEVPSISGLTTTTDISETVF